MGELTDETRRKLLDSARRAGCQSIKLPARDRYHEPDMDIDEYEAKRTPGGPGEPAEKVHIYSVELGLRFDKFHRDIFDTMPRDIEQDNDRVPMHEAGRRLLRDLGENTAKETGALPDDAVTVEVVNDEKGYVRLVFSHTTPVKAEDPAPVAIPPEPQPKPLRRNRP